MLTKNDIMYEKKFCDDLSNKYELLISQSPKEDIYFKYDHGKWRPHVRRNGKEIYLSPQKNMDIIDKLLIKKLAKESLNQLKNNMKLLESMEVEYTEIQDILLLAARKIEEQKTPPINLMDFLKPEALNLQAYRDKKSAGDWLAYHDKQNPYKPENRIHRTPAGVFVRSKSELVIATFLELNKIPYKYEEVLILEGKEFYPDFKILRESDGKIVVWEHLGMMEDKEYAEKNSYKQLVYARNGYRLGDNFIITYDDKGSLDMTVLQKLAKLMLK